MKAQETFALRRSVQPYVTLGAIFSGVAIWALVLAYRKLDRGTAESAILLLAFYAAYVFLGMRYRISVRDNTITQQAFGKRNVSIGIRDVSSVATEVSDAQAFVQMNRPMRRIVITSVRDGHATTIDVSIKHFLTADIRKLMQIIHLARPDLNVPNKWL
jgi:Ca2+/Na+ antiporter